MAKSQAIVGAILAAVILAGGLLPADEPAAETARLEPALTLPADPAGEKRLAAVGEYVRQKSWVEAVRLLQSILDAPGAFVPVRSADGKEIVRWTTLHAEADRLLGVLPAPGRESYERLQEGPARALLAGGRAEPEVLAQISRRYLHTPAGAEATRLLAVHHLGRGCPALAARYFERLLSLPNAGPLPATVLYAAALSFQHAGDPARAAQVWRQLTARAPGGMRFGDRVVSLADLRASLDGTRTAARDTNSLAGWPVFRGDTARSRSSAGGELAGEARWQHVIAHETATQTWVQAAVRRQEARGEPVLPAFFPIATADRVIFRSHRGVHAVDPATGRRLWESDLDGGLDTLGAELTHFPHVEAWVNAHLQHDPHVLFGNSVVGTLSTDGERVYAVDDLAVPPFQNTYHYRGRPVGALDFTFAPGLTEAVHHSRLLALDVQSGKVVWERGGPGAPLNDLSSTYFLGPPLPVGGRLYGLVEKDQELRLVCLDAASGRPLWKLGMGVAPARLLVEPARRLQAVPLAYSNGILVCPTHAGFVLGIDPFSRDLLWAYSYREPVPLTEAEVPAGARWGRGRSMPAPAAPPSLRPAWTASAPLIHDGKVVFTAPDASSVHCLRLRDGARLWKAKKAEGDLYLAAAARGKVLLVGKQGCRALDLADGRQVWTAATDPPCGLGILGESAYHLPTRTGDKVALHAMDLDSGRIRTQTLPAQYGAVGNLLYLADALVSQTASGITAYPLRK